MRRNSLPVDILIDFTSYACDASFAAHVVWEIPSNKRTRIPDHELLLPPLCLRCFIDFHRWKCTTVKLPLAPISHQNWKSGENYIIKSNGFLYKDSKMAHVQNRHNQVKRHLYQFSTLLMHFQCENSNTQFMEAPSSSLKWNGIQLVLATCYDLLCLYLNKSISTHQERERERVRGWEHLVVTFHQHIKIIRFHYVRF